MDQNKALSQIQWIKTPYKYIELNKNLSLLQQNILIKVSACLQQYWEKYWKAYYAKENPQSLITKTDVAELKPIHLTLEELGIKDSRYEKANIALDEIFDLKVVLPKETTKGTEMVKYHIFSAAALPVETTDDGEDKKKPTYIDKTRPYVEFTINPLVVDQIFGTAHGYVSHPENIARIAKQESMPKLYYLIKHYMNNWKKSSARIDFFEIKDSLGMIHRNEEGIIDHVTYPKYAHFRDRVLVKAMNEIHELFIQGKIDSDFTWEEERIRGKKTGEPKAIIFKLAQQKKVRSENVVKVENYSINEEPNGSWMDAYIEKYSNPTMKVGQKAWDTICSKINDNRKRSIFQSVKVERIENKAMILYGDKEDCDNFEKCLMDELDDAQRSWVINTLTSESSYEIKTFKYHYPSEESL